VRLAGWLAGLKPAERQCALPSQEVVLSQTIYQNMLTQLKSEDTGAVRDGDYSHWRKRLVCGPDKLFEFKAMLRRRRGKILG
tara:strand:+ start:367 stop:612 length:246 start_codon:yes stop_codon:yes gene_type:complete